MGKIVKVRHILLSEVDNSPLKTTTMSKKERFFISSIGFWVIKCSKKRKDILQCWDNANIELQLLRDGLYKQKTAELPIL